MLDGTRFKLKRIKAHDLQSGDWIVIGNHAWQVFEIRVQYSVGDTDSSVEAQGEQVRFTGNGKERVTVLRPQPPKEKRS